jgi:hypothetical protein
VVDICRREEVRWDVVYSTAELHGVAPLVYTNLQQCLPLGLSVPREILDQFQLCRARTAIRKERLTRKLVQALALFEAKHVDVMLIKGAALDALIYDQPWYTSPHDIDLVIRSRREEASERTIAEIGQLLDGTGIEYDYFEHHDVVINGALPIDFHRIWDDATVIRLDGHDVFVMSPEDTLMSVCINSCRKRFFKLKSLCDIAEVVRAYRDLRWDNLSRNSIAYECNSIIYAALLVTQMTVGCELPPNALTGLQVGPTRARIIDSLARYLNHRRPLSSLYPFSGAEVFGREVNVALLLPYATYHSHQVGRKMEEIYGAWRRKDGEQ